MPGASKRGYRQLRVTSLCLVCTDDILAASGGAEWSHTTLGQGACPAEAATVTNSSPEVSIATDRRKVIGNEGKISICQTVEIAISGLRRARHIHGMQLRTQSHDPRHCGPDPLGRGFDITVCKVRVSHGHADIGVAEQACDHRHRHAVHHRMARHGMPQVVKAHIVDSGVPAHPVPERQDRPARARRIERRRKTRTRSRGAAAGREWHGRGCRAGPSAVPSCCR